MIQLIPSLSLYFYSAIIEHTNRVIYLEDKDVAAVNNDGSKQTTTSLDSKNPSNY